ncbi:MAG: hypothetical protein ACYTDY_20290, partial [Planctomycetota bacterium]
MLGEVETLLRCEGRYSVERARVPWGHLAGLLVACGFLYGAAMGFFDSRLLQATYSGLKVPFLLVATSLVCLPNFFVVNTVLGLRRDFASACRGIVAAQTTAAIALAGLAPITLFIYSSTYDYDLAILLNGAAFLVATVAAHVTLTRHYRALIVKDPRHRFGRLSWVVLYVFVAIQLAWV